MAPHNFIPPCLSFLLLSLQAVNQFRWTSPHGTTLTSDPNYRLEAPMEALRFGNFREGCTESCYTHSCDLQQRKDTDFKMSHGEKPTLESTGKCQTGLYREKTVSIVGSPSLLS